MSIVQENFRIFPSWGAIHGINFNQCTTQLVSLILIRLSQFKLLGPVGKAPLQFVIYVVQNCHVGEEGMPWDETKCLPQHCFTLFSSNV